MSINYPHDRFLKVGRIYLIMSAIITISFYFSFGETLISEIGYDILWAFYCSAYIILITTRIVSNPNKQIMDRGVQFHTDFIEEGVVKKYISKTLKPRMQGILLSISFIIAAYLVTKTLIILLTGESAADLPVIKSDDLCSMIIMGLGVIPAVLISEIFLKIFPPYVQE